MLRSHVFSCFSHVQLFATLQIIAYQALLSMGFSRQEYWSGLPIPFPRGSSLPRDQAHDSLCLLHWQADSLPLVLPGKADYNDKKE